MITLYFNDETEETAFIEYLNAIGKNYKNGRLEGHIIIDDEVYNGLASLNFVQKIESEEELNKLTNFSKYDDCAYMFPKEYSECIAEHLSYHNLETEEDDADATIYAYDDPDEPWVVTIPKDFAHLLDDFAFSFEVLDAPVTTNCNKAKTFADDIEMKDKDSNMIKVIKAQIKNMLNAVKVKNISYMYKDMTLSQQNLCITVGKGVTPDIIIVSLLDRERQTSIFDVNIKDQTEESLLYAVLSARLYAKRFLGALDWTT